MSNLKRPCLGVHSGETFFRSHPAINQTGGMLEGIGQQLMEFLQSGQDISTINAKCEVTLQDLREAKKRAKDCRQARCQALQDAKQSAHRSCHTHLSQAQLFSSRYDQTLVASMRKLDRHLVALILRYYTILEEELAIHGWRMGEEQRICKRMMKQMQASHQLSLFALYLEHETSGRILLKRLPNSNPQFLRCRRAATENIKQNFFSGSQFTGISVLDVYKIENKLMLNVFQREAAKSEPGKVKGLFCGVDRDCLEHVVVYGMNSAPEAEQVWKEPAFRQSWFSVNNGNPTKESKDGYASSLVKSSNSVPFPRAFSRHSTLEEDRHLVKSPSKSHSKDDKENTSSGSHPEGIRYLALCRVLIGKVFVTSKAYQGFPPMAPETALDSMYNPLQEEYLILNSRHVLPEFVVQYKYTQDSPATGSNGPAGSVDYQSSTALTSGSARQRTHVVPCDLSTSNVLLPSTPSLTTANNVISSFPLRLLPQNPRITPSGSIEDSLPWDRIRQNAHGQREKMLQSVEAAFAAFWSEAEHLWRNIQKTNDASMSTGMDTTAAEQEIQMLEAELLKQTMRRRELLRDCQGAAKQGTKTRRKK